MSQLNLSKSEQSATPSAAKSSTSSVQTPNSSKSQAFVRPQSQRRTSRPVFHSPFPPNWEPQSESRTAELLAIFKAHFVDVKAQVNAARSACKRKKRKADSQQVPDEADTAELSSNLESHSNHGVVLGINAVTRSLAADKLTLVVACRDTVPSFLTSHLPFLSHVHGVPVSLLSCTSAQLGALFGLTTAICFGVLKSASRFESLLSDVGDAASVCRIPWLPHQVTPLPPRRTANLTRRAASDHHDAKKKAKITQSSTEKSAAEAMDSSSDAMIVMTVTPTAQSSTSSNKSNKSQSSSFSFASRLATSSTNPSSSLSAKQLEQSSSSSSQSSQSSSSSTSKSSSSSSSSSLVTDSLSSFAPRLHAVNMIDTDTTPNPSKQAAKKPKPSSSSSSSSCSSTLSASSSQPKQQQPSQKPQAGKPHGQQQQQQQRTAKK